MEARAFHQLPPDNERLVAGGPRYGGAIQTYTPPTLGRGQDWVLLLESADAALSKLPGQ